MFENPSFTPWGILYTAIGVVVFWGKWGRTELKTYGLSRFVRMFCKGKPATCIEFLIFVMLGCLVGIGVTSPQNPQQAITAGFGWTGIFTHRAARSDLHPSSKEKS